MKKLFAFVLFLINMIAIFGANENSLLATLSRENKLNMEILTGLLAFSVLGLFSIEMYKNRKNKN